MKIRGNLINFIEKFGGTVDAWFLTHPHEDHASCFIDIVNNTEIPIKAIYVSIHDLAWYEQYEGNRKEEVERLQNALNHNRIKEGVHEVSLNEQISIDFLTCEILGIKNPEITTNAINNSSMVVKMNVKNHSILFLGDTGVESGEKLLKTQKQKLKADYVQMAHHGQKGASKEVYEAIQPNTCLWPTPEWLWNNDTGSGIDSGPFLTLTTRKWMEDLKVHHHIIEKDGNISITID